MPPKEKRVVFGGGGGGGFYFFLTPPPPLQLFLQSGLCCVTRANSGAGMWSTITEEWRQKADSVLWIMLKLDFLQTSNAALAPLLYLIITLFYDYHAIFCQPHCKGRGINSIVCPAVLPFYFLSLMCMWYWLMTSGWFCVGTISLKLVWSV